MADFDKIYLDGVAYDVKDKVARDSTATLTTDVADLTQDVADLTQDVADNATEIASVRGAIRHYNLLNLAEYATANGYTITSRQIPGEVLEYFSQNFASNDVEGVYIPPNYRVILSSSVRWSGGIISGYSGKIIFLDGGQLKLITNGFAPNVFQGVEFDLVKQTTTGNSAAYIVAPPYTYFDDCRVAGEANVSFIKASSGQVYIRNCDFGSRFKLSATGTFSFLRGVSRLENCLANIVCTSQVDGDIFIFSNSVSVNDAPYYYNCYIALTANAGTLKHIYTAKNSYIYNSRLILGAPTTASSNLSAIAIDGELDVYIIGCYIDVSNSNYMSEAVKANDLTLHSCVIKGSMITEKRDTNTFEVIGNTFVHGCDIWDNASNNNNTWTFRYNLVYMTACTLHNCAIPNLINSNLAANISLT